MGEELAEHEGVVGLGVILGQTNVLVHVEGDDMLEREFTILYKLDEVLVSGYGRGAGGKPEDERLLGGGLEVVDAELRMRFRLKCESIGEN